MDCKFSHRGHSYQPPQLPQQRLPPFPELPWTPAVPSTSHDPPTPLKSYPLSPMYSPALTLSAPPPQAPLLPFLREIREHLTDTPEAPNPAPAANLQQGKVQNPCGGCLTLLSLSPSHDTPAGFSTSPAPPHRPLQAIRMPPSRQSSSSPTTQLWLRGQACPD